MSLDDLPLDKALLKLFTKKDCAHEPGLIRHLAQNLEGRYAGSVLAQPYLRVEWELSDVAGAAMAYVPQLHTIMYASDILQENLADHTALEGVPERITRTYGLVRMLFHEYTHADLAYAKEEPAVTPAASCLITSARIPPGDRARVIQRSHPMKAPKAFFNHFGQQQRTAVRFDRVDRPEWWPTGLATHTLPGAEEFVCELSACHDALNFTKALVKKAPNATAHLLKYTAQFYANSLAMAIEQIPAKAAAKIAVIQVNLAKGLAVGIEPAMELD